MASNRFDKTHCADLAILLRSDEPHTIRAALSIFEELGAKGHCVLSDALMHVHSSDDMVRSALIGGVMSQHRFVNERQLAIILPYANDDFPLVRERFIAFLSFVDIGLVKASIAYLNAEIVRRYSAAISLLEPPFKEIDTLMDIGLSDDRVAASFALSAILKMAKSGVMKEVPAYDGNEYVVEAVLANAARLARRYTRLAGRTT